MLGGETANAWGIAERTTDEAAINAKTDLPKNHWKDRCAIEAQNGCDGTSVRTAQVTAGDRERQPESKDEQLNEGHEIASFMRTRSSTSMPSSTATTLATGACRSKGLDPQREQAQLRLAVGTPLVPKAPHLLRKGGSLRGKT